MGDMLIHMKNYDWGGGEGKEGGVRESGSKWKGGKEGEREGREGGKKGGKEGERRKVGGRKYTTHERCSTICWKGLWHSTFHRVLWLMV